MQPICEICRDTGEVIVDALDLEYTSDWRRAYEGPRHFPAECPDCPLYCEHCDTPCRTEDGALRVPDDPRMVICSPHCLTQIVEDWQTDEELPDALVMYRAWAGSDLLAVDDPARDLADAMAQYIGWRLQHVQKVA